MSNSRNLAIKNANGKICLLSDDDVIYSSDFIDIIINSFNENKSADIITFEAINEFGKTPDLLVNNAGIVIFGGLEEQRIEDFKKSVDISLIGSYLILNLDWDQLLKLEMNIYF